MNIKISQEEYVIVIALHHLTEREKIYVQISSTVGLVFYDARERKRGRSSRWGVMGKSDLGGGFNAVAFRALPTSSENHITSVPPGSDRNSVTTSPLVLKLWLVNFRQLF